MPTLVTGPLPDPELHSWLTGHVLPPDHRARTLLVDRCPYSWAPWDPVCESTPPATPAAEVDWPMDVGPELTDRHRAVLAFEDQWWQAAGAKEQAIRDAFGVTPVRYYQLVNRLADSPAAAAAAPMLVARLRRLRTRRRPVGR